MNSILQCSHITKKFGSLTALDDVNFTIEPGRIVGLLGPNEAANLHLSSWPQAC